MSDKEESECCLTAFFSDLTQTLRRKNIRITSPIISTDNSTFTVIRRKICRWEEEVYVSAAQTITCEKEALMIIL
jgi:hypothetical protein